MNITKKETLPLLSIITPNFNSGKYIKETIQSVQAQTYQNWEMIIIDDGSTDNSLDIIRTETAKDPRITLHQNTKNKGQCYSRNKGINLANGKYLCFIDSDDLILPHKFETQIAFMLKNNFDITYTGYRRISENGQTIGHLIKGPQKITHNILLKNTAIGTLTPLLKKDIIGETRFDETLIAHEDFCFWLDIFKKGYKAHFFDSDTARYRRGYASVSSNVKRGAKYMWWILRNRERLSLTKASWCFINYAIRALLKRRKF